MTNVIKDNNKTEISEKKTKLKQKKFKIEIEFPTEEEMIKKYSELVSEGFLVKALF